MKCIIYNLANEGYYNMLRVHPKSVRQFFQETQMVVCIQVGVVVIPANEALLFNPVTLPRNRYRIIL